MKKILIVVGVAGAGAAIAFGARREFLEHSAVAEPQAAETAVGVPGGLQPSPPPSASPVEAEAVEGEASRTTLDSPGGAARAGGVSGDAAGVTVVEGADPVGRERSGRAGGIGSGSEAGAAAGASSEATSASADPAPAVAEPEPQSPDVAAILQRASAAYAEVRSLQADFVQRTENPLLRRTITSRGTIYQRRPDRFLMRFSEPEGDVIVSDGGHIWVYYPSVDEKQVVRMPAGAGGAGGVDLQAQFLGDPMKRFTPTYEGREEVAGRSAYVVTLDPREPVGYRRLKVWIDARDHLVRRFELTEENGSVRRFELTNLRINPSLGEELFRFTPPAGAHVVDRG